MLTVKEQKRSSFFPLLSNPSNPLINTAYSIPTPKELNL